MSGRAPAALHRGTAVRSLPRVPALVVGSVSHTRHQPIHRRFTHRHYQWLVDLDDLPDLGLVGRLYGRFHAADHLDRGRLGGGIRGDVQRFLRRRGLELGHDDRVLMLAHARVLGHTFDPLTVFWCLRPDGSELAVVLEVHNTYGERHAYLVRPDAAGESRVAKELYVSPFNDRSGHYRVRVRLDERHVAVQVVLHRDGRPVLTAATSGRPVPATRRVVLRTALRHAFMTQRVSLLIRMHGVRLWLSRLPVQPRLPHHEEGVR